MILRDGFNYPMLAVAALLAHSATAQAIPPETGHVNVRGVDPALLHHYTTDPTQFSCLSNNHKIPISAVNDNYCDCDDGSDEPGTSACEGRGVLFWCENKGHVPGRVGVGRVGDGICDYDECCDGSDEWETGLCPNKCAEIGKEYRERIAAEVKTRKTGAKIRGTYVKWAQGEKTRLQDVIEKKKGEVKAKEEEVAQAKVNLENVEAKSQEALEQRKQSPIYQTLISQRALLQRLRAHHATLETELKELKGILDDLTKGYNPNYQDMAVKAAVVGYEELYAPAQAAATDLPEGVEPIEVEKPAEKAPRVGEWELDQADRKDLEGLLLQDMQDAAVTDEGLLYKIDEYIPDMFYEQFDTVRETLVDWMVKLGIISGKAKIRSSSDAPYVTAAKTKHSDGQSALRRLQNDISHDELELSKLTGYEYGREGEWKKLDGTCVDTIAGDYTYELCFFGRAVQKSNKDHSSNHLGTFESWDTTKDAGSDAYYEKQAYRNGQVSLAHQSSLNLHLPPASPSAQQCCAFHHKLTIRARCWNGPLRSVNVELSCGTANALLSVSEPEKCEYKFKVTSPALCYPLVDGADAVAPSGSEKSKDEL